MQLLAIVAASLQIVVWPSGTGGASHAWTFRCGPAGGTLPQAAGACRKLDGHRSWFEPVPAGSVCTAIYGGPAVARVRGTLGNRRITATFNRKNGCELARWRRLSFLFR